MIKPRDSVTPRSVGDFDAPAPRASLDRVELRTRSVFDRVLELLSRARADDLPLPQLAASLVAFTRLVSHDDDHERRLHALAAAGEPLADVLIRAHLRVAEEQPDEMLLAAARAVPDGPPRVALARMIIELGLAERDPPSPLVMAAWDSVRTALAISPRAWRELLVATRDR